MVELICLVGPLVHNFNLILLDPKNPAQRSKRMVAPNNFVSLRPGVHLLALQKRGAQGNL
jgi:hypothetical protein